MEANTSRRTSRRSHTNLADLRLAPLSRDLSPIDTDLAFQSHHTSYIQGKSAPTTPGILGRTSSRRHLGGGLSRKLSIYDQDNPFDYAAVQVTEDGVPRHALRPDPGAQVMPKAKSEAALLVRRRTHHNTKLLSPQQHYHPNTANPRRVAATQDDWMTRAGLATSSLLRESKGQSWLVSRSSSTSLHNPQSSSDEEQEENMSRMGNSQQRLHFADDEFSPETPRATSRWGSRFGSRAPSARNSRRGSRIDLHPPELDYFDRAFANSESTIKPDFVDPGDMSDDEDPEQEVARLAREASFGFGSIVDRLVGWTLFNVDEDREATDVEDERETPTQRPPASRTPMPVQPWQPPPPTAQTEAQDEGGWQDAAWLLGVASKVLF